MICSAPRHGTESAYRQGCRCPEAIEDRRIRVKRRRDGVHPEAYAYVPIVGTQRRLRALAAIGWPIYELAPMLGMSDRQAEHHRSGRKPRIRRAAAARVRVLYERLSGTPGPSQLSRIRSAAAGWAPPLLWEGVDMDDPAATPAVDEVARQRRRVDEAEVEFLRGFGLSEAEVAARFGVKAASLERAMYRAREGVA